MQAPRLKSMFRNVRTSPRRFEFKSRHLSDLDEKWQERKQRIEQEVSAGENGEREPRTIRFRSRTVDSPRDRSDVRVAQIAGARWSMVRAAIIAAALIWLAWKGIQWVEQSYFSHVLKWMEDA